MQHAVRPVGGEGDGVEAGGHVGTGVTRAVDLVEQLRGDGADGDRSPGARVLGDDAAAIGVDLGDGEAGVADVVPRAERVVATGGLRAALDDVPGHDRPGERVQICRAPSRSAAAAGPTTRDASVTRPVTTTSAPASRQAAMPNPPR